MKEVVKKDKDRGYGYVVTMYIGRMEQETYYHQEKNDDGSWNKEKEIAYINRIHPNAKWEV